MQRRQAFNFLSTDDTAYTPYRFLSKRSAPAGSRCVEANWPDVRSGNPDETFANSYRC